MSLNSQGISCVRCRSYLFAEDDVVYCPVCGAPHHRECYNALGHCALEEFHGTENEYTRQAVLETAEKVEENNSAPKDNTIKCRMCGEEYDATLSKCPKCMTPDISKMRGLEGFDFLGGVPADADLGDGVTAEEAKKFVAANTHRYIPKFLNFKHKRRASWNSFPFLFPAGWMFSRKMYKNGTIAAIISIIANIMGFPAQKMLYDLGLMKNGRPIMDFELISQAVPEFNWIAVLLSFIGTSIIIGLWVISGLFGDYIYRNHAIKTIKKIKAESEDINEDYRKKGGANLLLFFLGTMITQYGAMLILLLL